MLLDSFHKLMGLGASSHVKEIKIDQNDEKWSQYKSQHPKKQGGFSASVKQRLTASASSCNERQLSLLRNANEVAEKRAIDAENRVRSLERDLATLELRNMELADEVTWLKQQLTEHPEAPLVPMKSVTNLKKTQSTASSIASDPDIRAKLAETRQLEAEVQFYKEELGKLKVTLTRESQKLEHEVGEIRRTTSVQINQLSEQLSRATKLNEEYEDILHRYAPQEAFQKLKENFLEESHSSFSGVNPAVTDELKTASTRTQLILELSDQLSQQKDRIRLLEDSIVHRDIEIGHLQELVATADKVLEGSVRKTSWKSVESGDALRPPVNDSLTSALRNVTSSDRIGATSTQSQVETQNVLIDSSPVDEAAVDFTLPKEQKRTVSGGKKCKSTPESAAEANKNVLRHVYTLSDRLEPLKVVEANSPLPTPTGRPSTAGSAKGARPKVLDGSRVRSVEFSMGGELMVQPTLAHHRGSSAPLFVRNRTCSGDQLVKPDSFDDGIGEANDLNNSGPIQPPNSSDMEVMSIMESDDRQPSYPSANCQSTLESIKDEPDEIDQILHTTVTEVVPKPPSGPKPPSCVLRAKLNGIAQMAPVGNIDRPSRDHSSDDDEDIKRLLGEMRNGHEKATVRPGAFRPKSSARSRVTSSAKSRDSGLGLGDSFTSISSGVGRPKIHRNDSLFGVDDDFLAQ